MLYRKIIGSLAGRGSSILPTGPSAGMLLAGMLLAAVPVAGLEPDRRLDQYVQRTWNLDDGLPQNSVNDLLQDRDGYLWLATYGGLARFDGVRFQVFAGQTHPGLPSDRFLALAEDRSGNLWIGTERSGLAVRRRNGTFERHTTAGGAPLGGVATLHPDGHGGLWVGGSRGLAHLGDGGWQRYGAGDGLPDELVLSVLEEPDGTLWVGTVAGLVQRRGGRFVPVLPNEVGSTPVYALYRDRGGAVWIGGSAGLFRWDGTVAVRVPVDADGGTVRDLLQDREENLWIALDPTGLRRLTPAGVLESHRRDDGLPRDLAMALLEDREGNLWVGTSGGGLHQLTRGEAIPFGGPHHPLGISVVPIVSDGAGGIWAGLNCGGVAHLDTARRVRLVGRPQGLTNTCVWALAPDGGGGLWIGTLGGGLFHMRGGGAEAGDITPLGGPDTRERVVRALLRGAGGDLFVGTDQGVFHLPGRPGDALTTAGRPALTRLPGTAPLYVYHLSEDRAGRLWIGTDDGVFVRRGDGRVLPFDARHAAALRGVAVRAIYHDTAHRDAAHRDAAHHDAGGAAWFGTYGRGLFRFDGARLAHLGTAEGLVENVVSVIREDRHGRFWMTGNRGVQRVPRAHLEAVADGRRRRVKAVHFGAGDGMPSSECNGGGQPAALLTDGGELWVPTLDGVALFDTDTDVRNPLPPPVHVEAVLVNGERFHTSGPPADRPLVLRPGDRNLEIHYTALSFTDPRQVRFRYRLEGHDDAWVEAGGRRVAYYPFLPPGDHRFRVIAANDDGVWNEDGASFAFSVRPRFVQTPLFAALLVLAVVALLTGAVQWRVRTLRRRERHLAREVATRTAELEETRASLEAANRRLARLANRDPLTGIPNRRSLMERLDTEWRRAVRQGRPLGLLMIDIDHFKPYNDLHGHPAGDTCLQRVVDRLDSALRRADEMLARYGGEELVAVIPEPGSRRELEELAETLRRRVEETLIPHGDSGVSPWVTVSIGGALVVPGLDDTVDALLAATDRALYTAKEAGRNRVRVVEMEGRGEG